MLPGARLDNLSAPFLTALFTATSAVSVTGLIVVDTSTYWSLFGQIVILALIQIGGFGVMTAATLLGLLVSRKLRLTSRLIAQAETRSLNLGDIRPAIKFILIATVTVEVCMALWLALALHFTYGERWPSALWHGLFHSISAFNNAGFSTYSNNLARFIGDPLILTPIMLAVVIGGIGFPVMFDIRNTPTRPSKWSIHTRITLVGSAILLLVGTLAIAAYEWTNVSTIGGLSTGEKVLESLFFSVVARTAGFNTIDIASLSSGTLAVTDGLMLIGGGSAGTAGGIKVTTFVVIILAIWAEMRGDKDVTIFWRRIPSDTQRQALAISGLAIAIIFIAVSILAAVSTFPQHILAFEAVSAFATVGLSTGITAALPPIGQIVLIVLMGLGRIGAFTFAASLALRPYEQPYRLPEERPIVG
jgi:trk system potassium uptake protein TrkH